MNGSIYSLKAILTKQPVVVASFIRQLLLLLVVAGAISLGEQTLAAVALVVELGLSLFTWSSVVPSAKVKEEQLTVIEEVQAPPEEPLPLPVPGDAP